jgi:hypothetical protein
MDQGSAMTYRQSVWGLSNGITVLAVSGLFWLSLGLGLGVRLVVSAENRAWLFPILALVNPALFIVLLVVAFRLRRKAKGFRLSEVRDGDEAARRETRRITQGFFYVGLIQALLAALVGFLCSYFQRPELAWPWIALVLGVHFIPIAWLLHVRAYYMTGLASTLVAVAAIAVLEGPHRTLFLGYGMGVVAWLSAAYVGWNAEGLAQELTAPGAANAAVNSAARAGHE